MSRTQRTGLGRGLGDLLASTEISEPAADSPRYETIPIADIVPNPRQPRREFDEDELAELSASLQELGLLQPIVVRPRKPDGYELVMGERRLRAATEAGWRSIPAIVRRTEDADMLRDALLENLHRAQLNPLEEAAAYEQLLQDFDCTQEELSARIKRSRPQISNTIRLLRLAPGVQRRVAAGVLSAGHARALLGLDDHEAQERLAARIVAENLTVRAAEELVALSAHAKTPRRPRPAREPDPRAREIADGLSERFDSRVKVEVGKNKGRIVIEFADDEDLRRILTIIESDQSLYR
ncbi:ParB/RepB/Spo0J family partition protein [Propionicicella superfundia]|uniref:ParB/RepB/Spo0J family partition protein n=1 Tax=Propionicicella superfundia TaxID=348582 RepID=UPI000402840F|nr:ParB/RepB/Spo0J family partition protein [Propionicicella superfundia]